MSTLVTAESVVHFAALAAGYKLIEDFCTPVVATLTFFTVEYRRFKGFLRRGRLFRWGSWFLRLRCHQSVERQWGGGLAVRAPRNRTGVKA